jgi:hypothetical protein
MSNKFTCRHTARLISDREERPLTWFEWLCLRVHLLGCDPCSRFGRAMRWLHRNLPSAPNNEQLSEDARERIRLALEEAVKEE